MSKNITLDSFSKGNYAEKLGAGTHNVRLHSLKLVGNDERARLTVCSAKGAEWTAWSRGDILKVAKAAKLSPQQLLSSFNKDGGAAGKAKYFRITLVERKAKNNTVYTNIV